MFSIFPATLKVLVIKVVRFLDNRSVPLGKLGKTVSFFLFKICVLKKDKVIPNSERICQKLDNFLNFQKIKLSDFWITFICKIDKVVRISDNISKLIFKKKKCCTTWGNFNKCSFPSPASATLPTAPPPPSTLTAAPPAH